MTSLAAEHKAINLSQGFPDFEGPQFLRDAYRDAINDSCYGQYAPMTFSPVLGEALSKVYKDRYALHFKKDEMTITNGATEAIFCTSLALLAPGDEAILIEPFYDSYPCAAKLAGADLKTVTLHGPDFRWNEEELEKAFSSKTKLVYLNNPQNPTGRVFTQKELNFLASLVEKYDCYVLSDEVYEYLTFGEHKHIPFATLEGMRERTVTISSAGKTFGHTGWKVGWALATAELSDAIRLVHQYNVFSVNHPAQYAVAKGLDELNNYLPDYRTLYNDLRLILRESLESCGFKPAQTEGTYFTMVPIPEMALKEGHTDISYCEYLMKEKKVATIPPSGFYLGSSEGKKYLRFCFAKQKETLEKAFVYLKS